MTNTAGFESFHIPAERVAELEARVEKINRKATKLNLPPVVLKVTDNTRENTVNVGGSIARLRRSPVISWTSREVLLKGETPKLNGWEFLSVVLHRPAGNDFVNVMDSMLDLSEFTFRDKQCDHCHKARVRNATFLVRHTDGTIKQVGSTCLEDYTGMKSPQAVARQLENIFDMFKELRGGGWVTGRTSKKFFVSEWLAWVAATMRVQGKYVGSNRSYDTGEAKTSYTAKQALLRYLDAPNEANVYLPTEADYATADAAITWARTDEAFESMTAFNPEFARQFAAATASDDEVVSEATMGIIAPAIAMHQRWVREQAKPVSEHVGVAKDRIVATVTIERKHGFDGAYGWTTIYNMRDDRGNLLVWFCTGKVEMDLNKTYTIEGTVKKHDTYQGENQTIVNRCKVICEVPA